MPDLAEEVRRLQNVRILLITTGSTLLGLGPSLLLAGQHFAGLATIALGILCFPIYAVLAPERYIFPKRESEAIAAAQRKPDEP